MELPEVVITCIRFPAIHCPDPRPRSNSCACGAATTSARSAAPRTIAVTERSGVTPRAYTEAAAPRLSDVGPMHGLGHLHVVGECSETGGAVAPGLVVEGLLARVHVLVSSVPSLEGAILESQSVRETERPGARTGAAGDRRRGRRGSAD